MSLASLVRMSEGFRSEILGTAGFTLAACVALLLALFRRPVVLRADERRRATALFVGAVACQALHFSEEYADVPSACAATDPRGTPSDPSSNMRLRRGSLPEKFFCCSWSSSDAIRITRRPLRMPGLPVPLALTASSVPSVHQVPGSRCRRHWRRGCK